MATEIPLLFVYEFPRGELRAKCTKSRLQPCSPLCLGGGIHNPFRFLLSSQTFTHTSCPMFFKWKFAEWRDWTRKLMMAYCGFQWRWCCPFGAFGKQRAVFWWSQWLSDSPGIERTTVQDCCHGEELRFYITSSVLLDNDVGAKPVFNHVNLDTYHKVTKFWGLGGGCFVYSIM